MSRCIFLDWRGAPLVRSVFRRSSLLHNACRVLFQHADLFFFFFASLFGGKPHGAGVCMRGTKNILLGLCRSKSDSNVCGAVSVFAHCCSKKKKKSRQFRGKPKNKNKKGGTWCRAVQSGNCCDDNCRFDSWCVVFTVLVLLVLTWTSARFSFVSLSLSL